METNTNTARVLIDYAGGEQLVECADSFGGPCTKAAGKRKPLGYTGGWEHGGAWMACACCGHQGSHVVGEGRPVPRCRQAAQA